MTEIKVGKSTIEEFNNLLSAIHEIYGDTPEAIEKIKDITKHFYSTHGYEVTFTPKTVRLTNKHKKFLDELVKEFKCKLYCDLERVGEEGEIGSKEQELLIKSMVMEHIVDNSPYQAPNGKPFKKTSFCAFFAVDKDSMNKYLGYSESDYSKFEPRQTKVLINIRKEIAYRIEDGLR